MPRYQTVSGIAASEIEGTVRRLRLQGATVQKHQAPDGTWTITATRGAPAEDRPAPSRAAAAPATGEPASRGFPEGVVGPAAPTGVDASSRGVSEFAGEALSLIDQDFEDAAQRLGCEVAAVRAVAQIESGGASGFLADKRPKILFESHKFSELTGGKFDATRPDISTSTWTRNYLGGAAEYDRLAKAIALDREAALKSASWGMFQILGMNHRSAGYDNVEAFVAAQRKSEGAHLKCFVNFVIHEGLADHLKNHNWEEFARRYNGPGYKKNQYHTKIAEAYRNYAVA